jgi:PAS domain S-box-containing protein
MNLSLFFWLYMGTICVNFLMIVYILKNRCANGATAFIFVLLFSSLWCFASAFENSVLGLSQKIMWAQIGFPAYALGPLAWFFMTLLLTDHRRWIHRKTILFLSIIPVITIILVFTNNVHGLIWSEMQLKTVQHLSVLSAEYGPWFYVHAIYSDGLNAISVILSVQFWRSKAPLYGNHYASLSLSMLFVMLVNLTYVFKIGPPVDLTPIAWGFASLSITRALFWNKLFDLMPIARERFMENVGSGVVILDLKSRVADLNPVATAVFACQAQNVVGMDTLHFFEGWPELQRQADEHTPRIEFKNCGRQGIRYFESSLLAAKQGGTKLGWFFIIRDISEQKQAQLELLKYQREIAAQEERMCMARDLHDDLGQILGFVNVQAQAVQEYIKHGKTAQAEACLVRLSEVARETHDHVRETIHAMRGEAPEHETSAGDFIKKLEHELQFFDHNTDMRIRTDFSAVKCTNIWDSKCEIQILKIIRESLNNICKHSQATEIFVSCAEKSETLAVTVSDNGRGFDAGSIDDGHCGLHFMRERAEEMGGHMRVSSGIGEGTAVELEIPLSAILCGKKGIL